MGWRDLVPRTHARPVILAAPDARRIAGEIVQVVPLGAGLATVRLSRRSSEVELAVADRIGLRMKRCPECAGDGVHHYYSRVAACARCYGTGRVVGADRIGGEPLGVVEPVKDAGAREARIVERIVALLAPTTLETGAA